MQINETDQMKRKIYAGNNWQNLCPEYLRKFRQNYHHKVTGVFFAGWAAVCVAAGKFDDKSRLFNSVKGLARS